MADDLKAVGVHLQITADGDANKYLQDMASKKFAAYSIGFGSQPVHLMGPALFLPAAAQFNPFASSDQQVQSLYDQAAAASAAGQASLDRQLIARLTDQAWFVPVGFTPVLNYYSKSTVSGVALSAKRPASDPVEWAPAGS
jgi:peptide/nickel transport system substrate-binding protein